MIVVNLYGGPCSGKSTAASYIFTFLKMKGINCELVNEFAKSLTWDESTKVLKDNVYIFGKQQHMLFRIKDKVDVAIMDSPILLAGFHTGDISDALRNVTLETYNSYNNINFFLHRDFPYVSLGRNETQERADEISLNIRDFLISNNIEFEDVLSCEESFRYMTNHILNLTLNSKK